MKKAGNFDICKAMAAEGLDIRMSPLDNITNVTYQKRTRGTLVTIGVDGNLVASLAFQNQFIGGLLLCDREQYLATKQRLESSQDSPDGETPQAEKEDP